MSNLVLYPSIVGLVVNVIVFVFLAEYFHEFSRSALGSPELQQKAYNLYVTFQTLYVFSLVVLVLLVLGVILSMILAATTKKKKA